MKRTDTDNTLETNIFHTIFFKGFGVFFAKKSFIKNGNKLRENKTD